jgi:hypothetical protein
MFSDFEIIVRIYRCIYTHGQFHQVVLKKGTNVEGIVCPLCNWILQKQNDEWLLKQTFGNRK